MAVIVEVRVADDPSAWSAAGFTLDGEGRGVLGTTTVRLVPVAIDGGPPGGPGGAVPRPPRPPARPPPGARPRAGGGARALPPRRTRDAGTGPDGIARRQRFFRLGEVILELVGPTTPTGDGPARFWGLAHEVADLDATAALLGDALTAPRDAVQAGRRIASLRRTAGVAVPTAFLTPDVGLGARRAGQ